ncbi:hypothetical protein [Fervidobacterium sp.]
MIHFLGDFYIDEIPNAKLSKNQIILLSYLSIKRNVYLNEALDILTVDDRYEMSYIKKLLKMLSEKMSPYIQLEFLRNSKVVAHINLQTDIQMLLDEIKNFEEGNSSLIESTERIIQHYTGHFLPFIDNIWVESYRNMLKSLVFSIFLKSHLSALTPISTKLKLLKIFPELYSANLNYEIVKLFSKRCDVEVLNTVFEFDSNITPVIISTKAPETLMKLLHESKKISVINNTDIIALVDSKLIDKVFEM